MSSITLRWHRASWLHPDSLRALNTIDVVFNKKKDQPVREAWEKVLAHAYTKRPDTNPTEAADWDNRLWDLRVDLYQQIGAAVGFDHSLDYIKRHMYYPQNCVSPVVLQEFPNRRVR